MYTNVMISNVLIYLLSFIGIWIGSGLAIGSVERVSKILRISSFAVSFLILGLFTSVSELSVGVNSILGNDPEIYVGNLIGASIVICMLVVPLLAITGNSIRISPEFRGFNLPVSLVVIALPVILAMDGRVGKIDSIIALSLFGFLVVTIQTKKSLLERIKSISVRSRVKVGKEVLRIVFGVATIFAASKFVVEQTVYFSELLGVSPFLISLLLIAVGTNVPELSFIFRSLFMKNNQVAFGDYVGSASFNTFFLGILTLIYGKPIYLTNSYLVSLLFLVFGLSAFYYFARTKNTISRVEGLVLLGIYLLFLSVEIYIHKDSLLPGF
jgi:cation:H+ antiporter